MLENDRRKLYLFLILNILQGLKELRNLIVFNSIKTNETFTIFSSDLSSYFSLIR